MNILLRKFKTSAHCWGAYIFVFLLPFNQFVSSCGIALWLILSLLSFKKEDINKNIWLILLPLLYASYFISILYSTNESYSVLERKLSLVIFPLLFFLHNYGIIQRQRILYYFIYGLVVSGMLCLFVAVYNSINIQDSSISFQANLIEGKGFVESIMYGGNYFFGVNLSIFHQTVYYAIYLNLGITLLLYNKLCLKIKYKLIFILFFCFLIFLISNKANILVLAVVILPKLICSKMNKRRKWSLLVVLMVVGILFVFKNPRMRNSIEQFKENGLSINKESRYDYKTRILSWDAALGLIKINPIFGSGVGDAQMELNNIYKEKGYTWPYKRNLNAHNQYMQLWIETGIFGLVVFLFVLFMMTSRAIKDKDLWVLVVVAIFSINAIFESILNRYSGISLLAFMCCFIFSKVNIRKLEN